MNTSLPKLGGMNLESVGVTTKLILNFAFVYLLIRLTMLMLDTELNGSAWEYFYSNCSSLACFVINVTLHFDQQLDLHLNIKSIITICCVQVLRAFLHRLQCKNIGWVWFQWLSLSLNSSNLKFPKAKSKSRLSSCPHLTQPPPKICCVCCMLWVPKLTVQMQNWYFCSFWWKTWIISFKIFFKQITMERTLTLFAFYVSFALQVWFHFSYLIFYFLRWFFLNFKPFQKLTTLSLLNDIFPLPLLPHSPSFNFLTSFSCWHLSYFPKLLSLQIFWLCCCLRIIFHASTPVKLVLMQFHCYYFWYECSKGIIVLLEIPVSRKK